MAIPNCKHYLKYKNTDEHVFLFFGKYQCDLLNCKNQEPGQAFEYNADGTWFRECLTDRYIENGDPVDKHGKLIGLKKSVDEDSEADFDNSVFNLDELNKIYSGIKPLDPKTNLSYTD